MSRRVSFRRFHAERRPPWGYYGGILPVSLFGTRKASQGPEPPFPTRGASSRYSLFYRVLRVFSGYNSRLFLGISDIPGEKELSPGAIAGVM